MTTTTELVSVELAPLAPLAPLPRAEVARALDDYAKLCEHVLAESDWQDVPREGKFLKRSGWRKLALAFSVNLERVESHVERDESGRITWASYTARATAPNGRTCTGEGYCDRWEKRFARGVAKDHDLLATAETRAKNRAAADLFGLGAVSAEEVEGSPAGQSSSGEGRRQSGPVGKPGPDWRAQFKEAVRGLPFQPGNASDEALATAIAFAATGERTPTRELRDEDRDAVLEVFKDVRDGRRVLGADGNLTAAGGDGS